MPDPILNFRKLLTTEDHEDHVELGSVNKTDAYAAEIVVGGVLLSNDASRERLVTAIDAVVGSSFCVCGNCESARADAADRSDAAFYLGLTAGLRLARATDGGAS